MDSAVNTGVFVIKICFHKTLHVSAIDVA